MTLFAFLIQAVGPLAIRVLIALGVSVATYTGVDAAMGVLIDQVKSQFAAVGDMAGLLNLAGVGQGMGMVLGAMSSRVALWGLTSATKFAVKGAS